MCAVHGPHAAREYLTYWCSQEPVFLSLFDLNSDMWLEVVVNPSDGYRQVVFGVRDQLSAGLRLLSQPSPEQVLRAEDHGHAHG